MLNFLLWILLGAVAGWIASMVMGKDHKMGALANIVVGIIGAFLGGWLLGLLGFEVNANAVSFENLLSAIFGAIVLLFLVSLVSGRRAA